MAVSKSIGIEIVNNTYKWIALEYKTLNNVSITSFGSANLEDKNSIKKNIHQSYIRPITVSITMASDQYKKIDNNLLELYPNIAIDYYVVFHTVSQVIAIPKNNFTTYIKNFNSRPLKLNWLEDYQQTIVRTVKFLLPKISLISKTDSIIFLTCNDFFINIDLLINYQPNLNVNFTTDPSCVKNTELILKHIYTNKINTNLIIILGGVNYVQFEILENTFKHVIVFNNLISEYIKNAPEDYTLALLVGLRKIMLRPLHA